MEDLYADENSSTFCIGRIINIDENYNEDREVDVECYDGSRRWQESCTVADPFGHWEGDGITFTPRVDAICMVAFVSGFDKPLITGFIKIPKSDGTVGNSSEDVDYPGDYTFKGIFGNFFKIHSSGAVTIESTPACNTAYLPYSDKISNLCRQYEILSDVGEVKWENFDDQSKVRYKHKVKRNLSDTNPVYSAVVGYADDEDHTLIVKLGDGLPAEGALGIVKAAAGQRSKEAEVNEKMTIKVKKDGSLNIKWADSETEIAWDELLKSLTTTIKGGLVETITRDVTRTIEGRIVAEITGAVEEKLGATWLVKATDKIDFQSPNVNIGSGSLEKMTLGETTKAFLGKLLDLLIAHQHGSAVGPTSPPMNAAEFTAHKSVDLEKILSSKHKNE